MSKEKEIDGHILMLVKKFTIQEQSELQGYLAEKGYAVPQATLSRYLKKLNIAKVRGCYKIISDSSPYLPIVLEMQISEFGLIVLKTHPGNANSLAFFLDQKYVSYLSADKNRPILGTIAGDDTLLLIAKDNAAISAIIKLLQSDFPYLAAPDELSQC